MNETTAAAMGEAQVALFRPDFNRSVRVVEADTVLTEDAGALPLRQASRRTGLDARPALLPDTRDPLYTTYSIAELVRTRVLLLAQGWADQGDANTLCYDPAFRLSVSDRAGETPLGADTHLASQPTLSRVQHALATDEGTLALERTVCGQALDRIQRAEPKRRHVVIDIDTTPMEVFGHQDGSGYNSHYHCTCFQPLMAFSDTGDLLAVRLRPSANPTAEAAFDFLAPVIDHAEARGLTVIVRMDAGFANAHMMRELDRRRVRFVTRLLSKAALHARTEEWYQQTLREWAAKPAPDGEPRTATDEASARWSRRSGRCHAARRRERSRSATTTWPPSSRVWRTTWLMPSARRSLRRRAGAGASAVFVNGSSRRRPRSSGMRARSCSESPRPRRHFGPRSGRSSAMTRRRRWRWPADHWGRLPMFAPDPHSTPYARTAASCPMHAETTLDAHRCHVATATALGGPPDEWSGLTAGPGPGKRNATPLGRVEGAS